MSEVPPAGFYYASPDLRALTGRDPVVAALFEKLTFAGTIAESGLAQPHELRAVIGVPDGTRRLARVTGFGPDPLRLSPGNPALDRAVMTAVAAVIWIPATTLIVVLVRLSARRRHRRGQALRSLGLSRALVRRIAGLEVAVVAVPFALVATIGYRIWVHHVTRIPGTEWGYFPHDADPGLRAQLVVVACIGAAAALIAASGFSETSPPAERRGPVSSSRISTMGLVVMGAGLCYLAGMQALPEIKPETMQFVVLGMWVADALVAVGLALSGPHLIGRLFRLLAGRVRSGGVLVGLRREASGSSTSLRLGALLAVVVVLFIGLLSFINLLRHGGQTNWAKTLDVGQRVPIVVTDGSGTLRLKDIAGVAEGTGAVQIMEVHRKRGDLRIVFGSCADLGLLGGSEPKHCSGAPQWIAVAGVTETSGRPTGSVKIPGGGIYTLPDDTSITELPSTMPRSLDGALLLPRSSAPSESTGNSDYLLLSTSHNLSLTVARLSGLAAGVTVDLAELRRLDPDTQGFRAHTQWLTIGLALALVIGVSALSAVTAAEASERRDGLRGLRLLGGPPRELRRAHLWSNGAPLIILGWTGVAAGCLAAGGLQAFDPRARVEYGTAAVIAVVVLVVGLLTALATYPSARRGAATG